MKKTLLTLTVTLAAFSTAKAIVVEQLVLKNGTELNGFIKAQKGDTYTFASDYATICLNKADIKEIKADTSYGLNDLTQAWINWASENDAFEGYGENRTLRLTDIVAKDREYRMVRILGNGEVVKFVEMSPNTYTVSWKNDVLAKKGFKRDKTAISGINVKYTLSNGQEYDGQFAEDTGNNMAIYLKNGTIQNFKTLDVIKYSYYAINPNQSLFEQAPLLDIVETTDGTLTGVIIEENYISKNARENSLTIQLESGEKRPVAMADAKEFRKEKNGQYKPLHDVVLSEGEFLVDRKAATFHYVTKDAQFLILDGIKPNVRVEMDGNRVATFDVEYLATEGTGNIFQLVKISRVAEKKDTICRFSYEDLVENVIPPIEEDAPTVNGTKRVTYQVFAEGGYALYDRIRRRAIVLIIK